MLPSVGPGEILLLAVVIAIIALTAGPKRLPGLARRAGTTVRQAKGEADEIRQALTVPPDDAEEPSKLPS